LRNKNRLLARKEFVWKHIDKAGNCSLNPDTTKEKVYIKARQLARRAARQVILE
jgi:hypothetical protein